MNELLVNSVGEKAFVVFSAHWLTDNNDAKRKSKRERVGKIIRQYISSTCAINDTYSESSIDKCVYNHLVENHTIAWTVFTDIQINVEIRTQLCNESARLIKYHVTMPYLFGNIHTKYQGHDPTYGFLQREFPFIWCVYNDDVIRGLIADEINECRNALNRCINEL